MKDESRKGQKRFLRFRFVIEIKCLKRIFQEKKDEN